MSNIQFGSYTPPPPPPGEIDIRLGIFFDGTQNNRKNSQAGGREPKHNRTQSEKNAYDKYSNKKDDSYLNDLSNVARKEYWYETNNEFVRKIYIEGIGTENHKSDSNSVNDHLGVAFGAGDTGIRAKVRKGCEEIVKEVVKLKKDKKVNSLTLDVFGFSRGAAAARNFVYEINKPKYKATTFVPPIQGSKPQNLDSDKFYTPLKELPPKGHLGLKLQENKINITTIYVRFLGLYDTVSSYDPNAKNISSSGNFDNDVNELHLNSIKAKKIVHLCADDEHRKNFMLTRIRIAGAKEFFLPGVHSDIGGCYTHNMPETDLQIMDLDNTMGDGLTDKEYDRILNNDLKNLISQAWFKVNEVVGPNKWHETKANRKKISNRYSFVTLQLLAECVNENYPSTINLQKLSFNYKVPNGKEEEYYPLDLTKVKSRLKEYLKGTKPYMKYYTNDQIEELRKRLAKNEIKKDDFNLIVNDHNLLIQLRNRYLHWNSKFGVIGLRPNYKVDKINFTIKRWRKIAPNS